MAKTTLNLNYIILAILLALIFNRFWSGQSIIKTIPYNEFVALVEADRIEQVHIGKDSISGTIKNPSEAEPTRFTTRLVDKRIADMFKGKSARIVGVKEETIISTIISWILTAIFFIAIWLIFIRLLTKRGDIGGSFMTVGKSKAKIYVEDDTKKTFSDVAGVDEAKEELREVVDFLKSPSVYTRLGARLPKGILLVGPPGTGKTLLARAVAGEAGVPFFSISGSEFVEMFVGVGAARVRDLFEQAATKAPCIIFIDELDALGKVRSIGRFSGNDEKEQTLNQLLVELDGFDSKSGLVILAATNRPEILDPALLRAGRFDRQVLIDRPDKHGRIDILRVHVKKLTKISKSLDIEAIATMTTGFSGADLENLVNEAALVATRKSREEVNTEDFNQAVERIVAGLERKNRVLNDNERAIVAHHEMGHAIISALLPTGEKLHKVSIIPRGIGALGYTIQRPIEDRFLMTKHELEQKITVLMGGRAAEELIFSHLSTGAADDLSKATNIAHSMVTKYGMCKAVGFLNLNGSYSENLLQDIPNQMPLKRYSEATNQQIDIAVKSIIDQCYDTAKLILQKNKEHLKKGARTLLEKETLEEADLADLFKQLIKADHILSPKKLQAPDQINPMPRQGDASA